MSVQVKGQIAFSIYSNFKEKLHLADLYSYFDDPLWQIIISDLLIINEKMSNKSSKIKDVSLSNVSLVRNKYTKKASFLITNADIKQKKYKPEELEPQDLKSFIKRKNVFMILDEFLKIQFPGNTPTLLNFMVYLLCGKDLVKYDTELMGIKTIKFNVIRRNVRVEYSMVHWELNHNENNAKIEHKQLTKMIKIIKPTANQNLINVGIKLYQALKLESPRGISAPDFSIPILKDQFIIITVRNYI